MPEKKHPTNARKIAELLDSRFTVPGTSIKIGLDPILGVLTGLGDWATAILSVYLMFYATKLGAKASVLFRMFVNIFIDLLIGVIPVLGDLFDVAWKANIRNVRLLEKLEADPSLTKSQNSIIMWALLIFLITILVGILFLIGWIITGIWELIF